jgi:hypothetical protein
MVEYSGIDELLNRHDERSFILEVWISQKEEISHHSRRECNAKKGGVLVPCCTSRARLPTKNESDQVLQSRCSSSFRESFCSDIRYDISAARGIKIIKQKVGYKDVYQKREVCKVLTGLANARRCYLAMTQVAVEQVCPAELMKD